jgi:hypothetical protein
VKKKGLIPVSALVVFGVMALSDVEREGRLPNTKEWLGYVVVFTAISAASDLGFEAAGGFAVLVMLTMLLTKGEDALKFLSGKVSAEPKKGTGKNVGPKKNPTERLA